MKIKIDEVKRYFGILKPNTEENVLWYEKELDVNSKDLIVYKYNNEGFRCDDFTVEKNGMHILFGGCSETEGAANKLEDVWAHILYEKIKDVHDLSGYYNVGKSGLTISGVIMNVFQYIYDYGCPEYIFLQFPDQIRYITWSESDGLQPKYPVLGEQIDYVKWDMFFKEHEESELLNVNIFYNYLLFKNLIQFCAVNNISLIWSSWNKPTSDYLISKLGRDKGYVDTSSLGKEHWDIPLKDLRARDFIHRGRGFHKIWANKFYEEFLNDQNNKKNNS